MKPRLGKVRYRKMDTVSSSGNEYEVAAYYNGRWHYLGYCATVGQCLFVKQSFQSAIDAIIAEATT